MVADTRRVAATPYWSGSPVTIGYRDAPRADPAPARVPRDHGFRSTRPWFAPAVAGRGV